MTNPNILAIIAAVFYVSAAVLLLMSLAQASHAARASESDLKSRRLLLLAALAAFIHSLVVVGQTGLPETLQLPLLVSLNAAALIIVWLLLIVCLRQPAEYLGLAVFPLAALVLLISTTIDAPSGALALHIQLHVLLSLTAYAFLSLAALQAILVWVQRNHLHNHKPGGFMHALPALDQTERLLFTLLTLGFVVLSMSLATGFLYLEDMFEQSLVHKTVLSVTAWVIFGALLFARWRWGWRGQRAVFWTLAGFAVLILAYFGSKFVLEWVLNRT